VLAGRLERLEKELAAIDEAVRQLRTGQAQRTKELEGELARIDEALRRVRTQMKAP
jgi:predicted  nucleic acid-binding Zn-ribbon protein